MTTYTCRTLGIARETLEQAQDGDTIRLVWPGANGFSRAAVESKALALGLDVVVEVGEEVKPDNKR